MSVILLQFLCEYFFLVAFLYYILIVFLLFFFLYSFLIGKVYFPMVGGV